MRKYHILLCEDEAEIQAYNRKQLEGRGYRVTTVRTIKQARQALAGDLPDLIVLDIMLPDGSGVELCREIRGDFRGPVLFLTSLAESGQIVQGLRAGGDDYMTKPYEAEELIARIEAHLRKMERFRSDILRAGSGRLYLNGTTQRAYVDGRDMLLKPKEFQILYLLLDNYGGCVTAQELYEAVWDMDDNRDIRTVWVHISNLRKKLKSSDGARVADIISEKSRGYHLEIYDPERTRGD
ncbi:MAG: response regulator transcription factor [Enterocloster asparagiformis]|nr:response regulator transcription factor [Enterocloster asparagiformis]